MNQNQMSFPISYVDFIPQCLQAPAMFKQPEFEKFNILMQRANQWLMQNPGFKSKTCESVEFLVDNFQNQGQYLTKTMFRESGNIGSSFIRGLRLWFCSKDAGDASEPQQLGYLSVVPTCLSAAGMFSKPKFENFAQTVDRINEMFRQNPIPGRLLNVETQDMTIKSWTGSVDADCSYFYKSADMGDSFVNVIRIFYVGGYPANEAIGCIDFSPACIQPGGWLTIGAFEPMTSVAAKANAWMAANPGLPVINLQSINYKMSASWDGTGTLDTLRTFYTESGAGSTLYLRILRVVFASTFDPSVMITRPGISCLSYRTFSPCQTTTGGVYTPPEFETVSDTVKRILAWTQATEAKVISAETVPILVQTGGLSQPWAIDPEAAYTFYRGGSDIAKYWRLVIRVYLDGTYQDPPSEVLPPAPLLQPTQEACCCSVM
ncbi:hypothetical protein CAPTEDRAFT_225021 [Capitella teleta]|uniref:Uncharacterized protein n=1 Tax=Capitella teleta TaxID=283909 RepID=R7V395_CAPTE|nr:hypothetical protein CAPTEDRAFT_225021 [Capitella teleta]|eukprot:ELU13029.1 hypothetical protein CAPTEDRAFT_225021 [Capitella teleta]